MSSNALALTAAQRDLIKAAWEKRSYMVQDWILSQAADHWEVHNRHDEGSGDEDSDDESDEFGWSNPVLDEANKDDLARGKLITSSANYHGEWELQISPNDTSATIAIAINWDIGTDGKEEWQSYILSRIANQDVPPSLFKFAWSSCSGAPITANQRGYINTVWNSADMDRSMQVCIRTCASDHWEFTCHRTEPYEWYRRLRGTRGEFTALEPNYHARWELLAISPDDTHATVVIYHSWEIDEDEKELLESEISDCLSNRCIPASLIKVTFVTCEPPRKTI
ncbi:hypothetical protein PG984_006583 [Apiospora sp. TS-2023a]